MKQHVIELPLIDHFSALAAFVKVPFSTSLNSLKSAAFTTSL